MCPTAQPEAMSKECKGWQGEQYDDQIVSIAFFFHHLLFIPTSFSLL